MSRRLIGISIISVAIFFLMGLAWELWSTRANQSETDPGLIVLCPKSWLSPAITEKIASRLKTPTIQLDFDSWSEFIRLAANTQGKADVICFHSFMAKDMIQSKFISHLDHKSFLHFHEISVDFLNLPFDPNYEYAVPLFWGANGFVIRTDPPVSWHSIWPTSAGQVSLLYPDLELIWRMTVSGLDLSEQDVDEESQKLRTFVQSFLKSVGGLFPSRPTWNESEMEGLKYVQMSSGPAALFLKTHPNWHYWLPGDGVSLWMGLAGIGAQSRSPALARQFIDEMINPTVAKEINSATGNSVVQASLDTDDQLQSMQKAKALRDVPLDRLRFPNLTIEALQLVERLVLESRH